MGKKRTKNQSSNNGETPKRKKLSSDSSSYNSEKCKEVSPLSNPKDVDCNIKRKSNKTKKQKLRLNGSSQKSKSSPTSVTNNLLNSNEKWKFDSELGWDDHSPLSEVADGITLYQPFNCGVLPNFFSSDIIKKVVKELKNMSLREKSNDMYKFHQSDELPSSGVFGQVREMLEGPVREWLCKVSGIELNDKVALSSSVYKHTDVLLCHDDELEGRRIAFILYLVEEDWSAQDGGSLDLFSVDAAGRPDRVVQRIYPKRNSFAFFEVSPVSFHQVSEVLSPNKVRLSINGWFHGSNITRPPKPVVPRKIFSPSGHVERSTLFAWLNPLFLAESTQESIRKQFQKDSEILLDDFILEEKFQKLCDELKANEGWQWVGPSNRLHLKVLDKVLSDKKSQDTLPLLQEFLSVMRSEAMFLILSQLTGLKLHQLAPESDGESDGESNGESDGESNGESDEEKNHIGESSDEGVSQESDDKSVEGAITLRTIQKEMKSVQSAPLKKKTKPDFSLGETWTFNRGIGDSRDDAEKSSKVFSSVQRMSHGCYSVIRDDDNSHNTGKDSFVLDSFLFCNVPEKWTDEFGGHVTYLAKGEEQELLTISPKNNSLALVYRDADTFSFLKHVNCKAKKRAYDCVTCQYIGEEN